MIMFSPQRAHSRGRLQRIPLLAAAFAALAGCSAATSSSGADAGGAGWMASVPAPNPDPRVGLKAGQFDAQEAVWNMRVLSRTRPPEKFVGSTMSDLPFLANSPIPATSTPSHT